MILLLFDLPLFIILNCTPDENMIITHPIQKWSQTGPYHLISQPLFFSLFDFGHSLQTIIHQNRLVNFADAELDHYLVYTIVV